MKKKLVIPFLLLVTLFILSSCTNINIPAEESTEYDYSLDCILVLIKKEYSEFGKEFSPEDFDEELIESVRVINQIQPGDDLSGYDIEYWQQILELKLKEPSAENVKKAIEAAYKNSQVQVATENYHIIMDFEHERNNGKSD